MSNTFFGQPIGAPTVWELAGRDQPPVSSVNSGLIYFDATSGKFMVSEAGGVFVQLVGGGSSSDLATVLGVGNTTGPNNIVVSSGQRIDSDPSGTLRLGTTDATNVQIGAPLQAGSTALVAANEVTLRLGNGDPNRAPSVNVFDATPSIVRFLTPDGVVGDTSGGDLSITLGSAHGLGTGGSFTLIAGAGDLAGAGQVNIFAGPSGSGGTGGDLQLSSGNTLAGSNQNGGILQLSTGSGDGTGNGGQMQFVTGSGGASGKDGNIIFAPSGNTSTPGSVNLQRFFGSAPVSMRFWDGGGGNYTGLVAPSAPTGVTFALPAADGTSGQSIITDGSGNLSFGAPSLDKVLLAGNTTGASSILVTPGQQIDTAAAGQLSLGMTNATSFAMGNATLGTQQFFLNQGGVTLHGSGSGVQYSSTVASRSQYRVNQYGNNAGVPGISSFKSRGATIGSLAAVVDGDVIFRDTAVGVCGDNTSIPLSGMISIDVPTGGSVPGQNWIATSFQVQLVPLEGPINGRKEMFRITSQGVLCVRETANRMAGTATLDGTGTAVIANTAVKATTKFTLTAQDSGTAPSGTLYQASRVAGTSFTIKSSAGGTDAGVVVYYQLWEPTIP